MGRGREREKKKESEKKKERERDQLNFIVFSSKVMKGVFALKIPKKREERICVCGRVDVSGSV